MHRNSTFQPLLIREEEGETKEKEKGEKKREGATHAPIVPKIFLRLKGPAWNSSSGVKRRRLMGTQ